ncbi:MAG: hypothetical protein DRQ63_03820 [Gammaproteobacteria bacterium]|nr:MAG: hypothetical protein DRQ63_03820 [Gammaproteobacteria bacterium]
MHSPYPAKQCCNCHTAENSAQQRLLREDAFDIRFRIFFFAGLGVFLF